MNTGNLRRADTFYRYDSAHPEEKKLKTWHRTAEDEIEEIKSLFQIKTLVSELLIQIY